MDIYKMNSTNAEKTISVLDKTFSLFGFPKQLVYDNGPPFTSREIDTYMKSNGINHILTPPYHPSSNGAAENAVKLVKKCIKKAISDKINIELALNKFLVDYRNSITTVTSKTPAELMFGRNLN